MGSSPVAFKYFSVYFFHFFFFRFACFFVFIFDFVHNWILACVYVIISVSLHVINSLHAEYF